MGMADIFQVFKLFQTVYCLLLSMAWDMMQGYFDAMTMIGPVS